MHIINHRLLFSLALLAALVAAGCADSGPASTVKQFYRSVESGELEEASEMLTGQMVAMLGRDKIKAAMGKAMADSSKKGGIQSVDILSEEVDGAVAKVHLRMTYGNGETKEEELELIKVDGRWLISLDGRK